MSGDDQDLLEGEDPGSSDPADAQHWVRVYRELLSEMRTVNPTSATHAATLAGRIRLFESRLASWEATHRRLVNPGRSD